MVAGKILQQLHLKRKKNLMSSRTWLGLQISFEFNYNQDFKVLKTYNRTKNSCKIELLKKISWFKRN